MNDIDRLILSLTQANTAFQSLWFQTLNSTALFNMSKKSFLIRDILANRQNSLSDKDQAQDVLDLLVRRNSLSKCSKEQVSMTLKNDLASTDVIEDQLAELNLTTTPTSATNKLHSTLACAPLLQNWFTISQNGLSLPQVFDSVPLSACFKPEMNWLEEKCLLNANSCDLYRQLYYCALQQQLTTDMTADPIIENDISHQPLPLLDCSPISNISTAVDQTRESLKTVKKLSGKNSRQPNKQNNIKRDLASSAQKSKTSFKSRTQIPSKGKVNQKSKTGVNKKQESSLANKPQETSNVSRLNERNDDSIKSDSKMFPLLDSFLDPGKSVWADCSLDNSTVDCHCDEERDESGGCTETSQVVVACAARSKCKKLRRNRTVFTELQLMGLERRFDSQKYLSTPDRADLARALGLTQLQVKTWYQNRRMKWKKQVMQNGCPYPPTKPKGRPKKDSIPTYGLEFTNSILCPIFASHSGQTCSDSS